MTYTVNKVQNQDLAYAITTEHKGEEITFIVVCANSDAEIPELVEFHLNQLDAPTPVYEAPAEPQVDLQTLVQQQQELIQSLTDRIAALEN
jgi:hypothetical protein